MTLSLPSELMLDLPDNYVLPFLFRTHCYVYTAGVRTSDIARQTAFSRGIVKKPPLRCKEAQTIQHKPHTGGPPEITSEIRQHTTDFVEAQVEDSL